MALMSTLVDDFDTLDTSKWSFTAGITVSGGQLVVPCASTYAFASSVATYDLTGSALSVQVVQRPTVGNGSTDAVMQFGDNTNGLRFILEGSTLFAQHAVAGSNVTAASAIYNAVNHRWWKIAESGGTIIYSTSADGVSWSTFGTWVLSGLTVTARGANLQSGYFGTESSPSPAIYDSFNIVPPLPSTPYRVSDRGTAADATAATTSAVPLTSPAAIAVGNYLIARVAVDNSGTNGAAPGCTVTDPRSNTWTVLGPALVDPGVAAAGATAYIAYAKVGTAYQAADSLTFNWGGISTTAKAIVVEEWTNLDPTTPVAVAAVQATGTASAALSIGATPTAPNQLVYTCLATEGIIGDTAPNDTDTTNGSWSALNRLASANATATNNQCVAGASKVVTASGAQTWDSTITARDWAALSVVFAPAPSTVSVGTGAGTFTYVGTSAGSRAPKATAAGAYAYAGAAAGKRVARATATGTYTYVGAGTGKRVAGAAGSGTYAYAGAAAGKRVPKSTLSGSFTYVGAGTGKRSPAAAGAGAYAYAGTATGKRVAKATTAGTYAYVGTGVGKHTSKGAGATGGGFGQDPFGSLPFGSGPNTIHYSGVALGAAPKPGGVGSGSWQYAGAATGKRRPKATGPGAYGYAGAATGIATRRGQASGTYAYAGSASGKRITRSIGSGSYAYVGTASGKRVARATTAGTYAYVGTATSKRSPKASGSGLFAYVGAAAGKTARGGVGSGAWFYSGSASGKRVPKALANGAWQYAGAAVGAPSRRGSGSGSWTYVGLAQGSQLPFETFGEEFFAFL